MKPRIRSIVLISIPLLLGGCRPVGPATTSAIATPAPTANTPPAAPAASEQTMAPSDATSQPTRIEKTSSEWRSQLSAQQYRILREKGTERAFSGEYWDTPASFGEYRCAGCSALLFRGKDKFVSECGWPAFDKAIKGSINYISDRSFGMVRTEVTCARCDGHLGHVFEDGPTDTTGVRYCINSVSITYTPLTDEAKTKNLATEAIADPK